jgi:hypothetical protein
MPQEKDNVVFATKMVATSTHSEMESKISMVQDPNSRSIPPSQSQLLLNSLPLMDQIMVILRKSKDFGSKMEEESKLQEPAYQVFHPTTQSLMKTALFKNNFSVIPTPLLLRVA